MLKKRFFGIIGAFLGVTILLGGTFVLGFNSGRQFPETLIVREVQNIEPNEPTGADFSTFWEAWQTINDTYLRSDEVAPQEKAYGAIRGLVGSLDDQYSEFLSPEDNKKFEQDIRGNFGGIGAEIGIRQSKLVVIAPLKDTPASKAGLKPGDLIIKIDDTFTDGLTVDEAISLIRGKENTVVVLAIFRENWEEPQEFKITRATITVPTIDFEMRGDIAHIELHSFNANANALFQQAVVKAIAANAQGLVLDLRNNPGGFLSVAVDLSGWFLKRGTLVVREEGRDNDRKEFQANGNEALADLPVVILVNGGSASASEILAGALKDQRKIKLVGQKTFGKGTVQELISLRDDSSLKLTVAHWVLPSGKIIEGEGIKPDFEVKPAEDGTKELDPQLDKAIEVLRGEINKK